MKSTLHTVAVFVFALLVLVVAGCNAAQDASNAKMAEARDAQFKSMGAQRKSGSVTTRGAASADAAGKAAPASSGSTGQ